MKKLAKVYLVGTGPGDPDLLTVKALRLLQNADVVIYDRLVSDAVLEQIPSGVTRIYVGKKTGKHTLVQDEINQLLSKLADGERIIVRLKGGDPFVFGRGSEEALWLAQHNIPFEVVPGITAASACAAYAGIPLTHRGLAQGVQFITGHGQSDQALDLDWKSLADANKTIVVYMGLANIEFITEKLTAAGLSPDIPAAAIENGTLSQQRQVVTTLNKLARKAVEAEMRAPVIFVIGQVVSLAEQLSWFVSDEVNGQGVANRDRTSYG